MVVVWAEPKVLDENKMNSQYAIQYILLHHPYKDELTINGCSTD